MSPSKPVANSAQANVLGVGFAIGVATSGYQIEGGYNGHGEPANNWRDWEGTGRVERSGVACDFWAHPEEVLDRAQSIGCNTFRLSVEWARLEQAPGQYDHAALERYVEILTMCRARGLEPVISLHHFSHPWFHGEEFWLRPGSPDVFARYVARVVPALLPHCRKWVTINEPNILMLMGWIEGACPPGRKLAVADAYCVLDNLLTGHVLASDIVVAMQPEAEVTCNTSSSSIYEHDRMLTDLLLLKSFDVDPSDVDRFIDERRALHDAAFPPQHWGEFGLRKYFASVSPYGTNGGAGGGAAWSRFRSVTRRPAPRRVVDAVMRSTQARPLGAIGFDWYDPVASHATRLPGRRGPDARRQWSSGRDIWDVVPDAPALTNWCRTESALHPDLPIWVVENGMATRVTGGRHVPREDGLRRPEYLRQHLRAVVEAKDAGVPVTAYLHWSLVDNYEWGTYEPRLGLFGIDRSDPSGAIRWMDTDAQGDDASGEFARLVSALVSGDRSVLEGPAVS